jgi:hypothetical protein
MRFLKQARHRASRLFLRDGARSSLPQYLQIRFSVLDATREGRGGRCTAFVAFALRVDLCAGRRPAFHRRYRLIGLAALIDQGSRRGFGVSVQVSSPSRARAWYRPPS